MEDVDFLHRLALQGSVQILREVGDRTQHLCKLRGQGAAHHLLGAVGLNIVFSLAVDLKGQPPVQQQGEDGTAGVWVHGPAVEPLPRGHIQHRRAVGQHGIPGDADLGVHRPQQGPGPTAGDGHRRPPLRRRPEGGHVPGRHSGVVIIQQGTVHVQTDQSDVVHFFSFRAWRTFSMMPSVVRP